MGSYILRRLLQTVPVFFGVTICLFLLRAPGVLPGDPVRMITGEKPMTRALRDKVVADHKLDRPLAEQYVFYLERLAHGDLGRSLKRDRDVAGILAERLPYTAALALTAIGIEILIGIAAGLVAALRRRSFVDALTTVSTAVLVAIPAFWLGMLLQTVFGVWSSEWGVPGLPVSGTAPPGVPGWAAVILPAVTLASVSTAYVVRMMRAQLLEVGGQDYVTAARAKGLRAGDVMVRHTLRNALMPVVTLIALDLGAMMGGAILTETVFSWPGIGLEIHAAILARDWPIVMGGVVLVVFVVMAVNLAADIGHACLDPRVRDGSFAGQVAT